jgi:flagellar biosynthesis protein FliR
LRILITLNRGQNIKEIISFIKNIFIFLNLNLEVYVIQNVKDSLHYISMNKNIFNISEEEMIDINMLLSNIKNRY